jgi:hypothetical protein
MIWRPAIIAALWLAITATPTLAATEDSPPETMQKQFETMQQTMNKVHGTKDTGERNALMQQHMAEMMSGMQTIHGMMGGGMMGRESGAMMGGQSSGSMGSQSHSMMGRGQSGSMMGAQSSGTMGSQSSSSTSQGQQTDSMAAMQQRMSMMWMMMNQMMQHMQAQQRLEQPKQ